jgi:glutaminyl-tRNA synthetase
MPTIAGFRRRGYTPKAIRDFCEEAGVTKFESLIDLGRLENACREHLNAVAPRAMCVLRPLKVVIENWPAGHVEELDFVINPEALERAKASGESVHAATRKIPFSGTIFIEREDFMEVPEKKFFRLAPGQEVRLRWAYFIKCVGVEKDPAGNLTAVRCTYDPATRGGDAPDGRKVKGTLHWVSAHHGFDATVRLYDRLFKAEEPGKATGDWHDDLNPRSLETLTAKIDPGLRGAGVGDTFQFERQGYFRVDEMSNAGKMVFNRTVTLKDGWGKGGQK